MMNKIQLFHYLYLADGHSTDLLAKLNKNISRNINNKHTKQPKIEDEKAIMDQVTTFSGLPAHTFMPTAEEKEKQAKLLALKPKKTKEQKKAEDRKQFWKKYLIILFATPLIIYAYDNYKAKKSAKNIASYIANTGSDDCRMIRDLSNINNKQFMDFYFWLLENTTANEYSIDEFGALFTNAVRIFKERNKDLNEKQMRDDKMLRLSRKYKYGISDFSDKDKKREFKWLTKRLEKIQESRLTTKFAELQSWDIHSLFNAYELEASDVLSIGTYFVALAQCSTDELYLKIEIAFRIVGQQLYEVHPMMDFGKLIEFVDDMILTGHFSTDSLIVRSHFFPSKFTVRSAQNIVELIYECAGIDCNSKISFEQFGQALQTLANGRKWYESTVGFFLPSNYKPYLMVWYCSPRSVEDVNRRENREKKEEKKRQKAMAESSSVETVV